MILDTHPNITKEKLFYENSFIVSKKQIDILTDLCVLDTDAVIKNWNVDFEIITFTGDTAHLDISKRNTFVRKNYYGNGTFNENNFVVVYDPIYCFKELFPKEQALEIIQKLELVSYSGYGYAQIFISKETAKVNYDFCVGILNENKDIWTKEKQEAYFLENVQKFKNLM